MADVRIIDLPAGLPSAASQIAIDLSETQKATVSQIGDAARPFASQSEAEAGVDNTKTMTPLTVAQQLAARGPTIFATVAEGFLASTALQPADVSALAFKDKAEIADIDATGSPTSTTFLAGDGSWKFLPGGGNMLSSVYDPDSVGEEVAFRSSAIFRVASLASAGVASIPDTVDSVILEQEGDQYSVVDDEPGHSFKFQNGGRWFALDAPTITPRSANAATRPLSVSGVLPESVWQSKFRGEFPVIQYLRAIDIVSAEAVEAYDIASQDGDKVLAAVRAAGDDALRYLQNGPSNTMAAVMRFPVGHIGLKDELFSDAFQSDWWSQVNLQTEDAHSRR